MHDDPRLIEIRKLPPGAVTPWPRVGPWMWTCHSCAIKTYGLDSHTAAVQDARQHVITLFDSHHQQEWSSPCGNRHHIACRCGWTCTNERDEYAAEMALEWHITYMQQELDRETAAEVAA